MASTDVGRPAEEAPGDWPAGPPGDWCAERPEGVAAGTALLTGPRASAIVEHTARLLTDERAYQAMAGAKNPYGDGHAAERIVERIRRHFAGPAVPPG